MNITESIKFNKLQEENEKLKKEIIEKNKEIEELKSKQLFEEDFDNIDIQSNIHNFSELEWNYFQKYNFFVNNESLIRMFVLKNSSKYELLESKGEE